MAEVSRQFNVQRIAEVVRAAGPKMGHLSTPWARYCSGVLVACLAAAPAHAAAPAQTVGVFRGAVNARAVAEWEAWLGRPAHRVLDFLARENWTKIGAPDWWVGNWGRSPYRDRVVYSVPLLPNTPSTLAAGARGAYDAHFARLARLLVAHGQGRATIRLGWEFNGRWYRWNAARNPRAFVVYWRRVVSAMRRQPGAAFRFDWCPNLGRGTIAPRRVYPGDAYVDFIGADVYDHGWRPGYRRPEVRWRELRDQPYGLRWQRRFARTHRKRVSFPEWGLVERADGHGGGDSPYFVRHMHRWIATSNVAYHNYFEVDTPGAAIRLMTGRFPRAARTFRRLFGRGARAAGRAAPPEPG
jgi:Glycosyl hydrolase family 26